MLPEDKNDFNRAARDWDKNKMRDLRAKSIAEAIIKTVPGPGKLKAMEYGCGTGLLGIRLLPHFKHITFCDNSPGMIEVLRDKLNKLELSNYSTIVADLAVEKNSNITLDNTYDCIFNLMALHHIPDIDGIILTWSRLLKSGGYLCIADLDEENGSFHGAGYTGHNGISRDNLCRCLKKYGFSGIKTETQFTVNKLTDSGKTQSFTVFLMCGIESGSI